MKQTILILALLIGVSGCNHLDPKERVDKIQIIISKLPHEVQKCINVAYKPVVDMKMHWTYSGDLDYLLILSERCLTSIDEEKNN